MAQETPSISKMETVQTAVEYLIEKLYTNYRFEFSGTIVDEAKAMEKEQIIDAYWNGTIDIDKKYAILQAEEYYNEKYYK
jgi:HEPN domain-containing protein